MSRRQRADLRADPEASRILLDIAATLFACASGDVAIEPWRLAACATQIVRIVNPPPRKPSSGSPKEFAIAISYTIRRELHPKDFKSSRHKTAIKYGVSEASVMTLATRHRAIAQSYLARLESRVGYDGLTRRQMLQKELREIEPRNSRVKQTRR